MPITVTNKSKNTCGVAINKWGANGNTGFYSLDVNKKDSWARDDYRGFIMCISNRGVVRPYYVFAGDNVVINEDGVTVGGRTIEPITTEPLPSEGIMEE